MDGIGVHRPRNLDWKRAAALLYGDWGTSKAYVIGLAFVAAGYSALPIIAAVCFLTLVVGYNYSIICRHFPDGGGVYSAARDQSRVLAVIGALLLVANFAVTAALSGWAAMTYFGLTSGTVRWATMGIILLIGVINHFGPKHTGNIAAAMAVPMVVVVLLIIIASAPHLTTEYLERSTASFSKNWVAFAGMILALSGVEAIANLTGVMKLDRNSTMENPRVSSTSTKAIWPVAIEVVIGTTLLGWAMLSVPKELYGTLSDRCGDMVRFLAEHYGSLAATDYFRFEPHLAQHVGSIFGFVVGIVIGLLLLSAVNTAISAMIGLIYMLSRDGEMPRSFTRLNAHGVPRVPLILATLLPFAVTAVATNLESLAGL